INISKGPSQPTTPATVGVPDVAGQSTEAATNVIRAAGLEPSIQHVPSIQPTNTVVSQSPAGGNTAHHGDHVLINISDGPPKKDKATATKSSTSQQPSASHQPTESQPATEPVPTVIGEDE